MNPNIVADATTKASARVFQYLRIIVNSSIAEGAPTIRVFGVIIPFLLLLYRKPVPRTDTSPALVMS